MKTIKLFAIAAACIALFVSCNKAGTDDSANVSAIQKQLVGTWEGQIRNTATLNGKEIEMSVTPVVLTFTNTQMTRKDGDLAAVTYDYVIKNGGSKGYYFVSSFKGEEVGSIWFEISGNTMNLTAGDGTFFMTFPKTFTKK